MTNVNVTPVREFGASFLCFFAASALLSWLMAPAFGADLVITNARVFSGTDAPVLPRANIVITGEQIESISTGAVDTAGTMVVDAGGKTVMPGLIDAHVHLFFDLQGGARFPTNDAEARAYIDGRLREKLRYLLEHGFTTVLSPIDFWPEIVEARDRVRSGQFSGPRLLIGGGVFVAPGGHYICRGQQGEARTWCDEHISVPVSGPGHARDGVRRYVDSGVDFIVYDSVTNSPQLPRDIIAAMVGEADRHGLKVLVHGSDAAGVASLVSWGIDGFVHPPGGTRDVDGGLLDSAGRRQIPIGITIGETEEAIRQGRLSAEQIAAYETTRHNVATLLQAGAVPVYASDMPGTHPSETLPIVLRSLSDLGLTNAEVLRAATRDAAHALLGDERLGTLEPGKLADIVIVDGDPLENLEALADVQVVIQSGRIVVDKR